MFLFYCFFLVEINYPITHYLNSTLQTSSYWEFIKAEVGVNS